MRLTINLETTDLYRRVLEVGAVSELLLDIMAVDGACGLWVLPMLQLDVEVRRTAPDVSRATRPV